MELVVSGDVRDDGAVHEGVELWRRPFLGWDHPHPMPAEAWCRPRRYAVVDMGSERASGTVGGAALVAGQLFLLTVSRGGAARSRTV